MFWLYVPFFVYIQKNIRQAISEGDSLAVFPDGYGCFFVDYDYLTDVAIQKLTWVELKFENKSQFCNCCLRMRTARERRRVVPIRVRR